MVRTWIVGGLLFCAPLLAAGGDACGVNAPEIGQAFDNLYNFNFPAAHAVLNKYIAAHPQESVPYAIRGSAYLFYELNRLGILESQFLTSDKRIADKKGLKPDPDVRAKLMQTLEDAQARATAALNANPNDRQGLFTMAMVTGISTDYMAFVEKRQIASLTTAKRSNSYAQQLLKLKPTCEDAYMTAGLSEYMVGSLPFFIRWFVRFDNVEGSKDQGIRNLQLVARDGQYFKAFAKILLAIISLREKRPQDSERFLEDLARTYPSNPLFRKELANLTTLNASGTRQN
ncbi:MAG: hypothetical protein U0Q18_20400 [Bryobacteraceae bacterium]